MTRKDFELIARTLKLMRPRPYTREYGAWRAIVTQFRLELNHTNPLFDGEYFFRACEYMPTPQEVREHGIESAIELRGTMGVMD
jgi:hypothetical protein